ncbi:hypothetical protein NM208_g14824 [Fusarium decemcellulare]|uniref:Uncharacterized protein n=1 Tax=Fusarium decemcellulare TaxID=57161 RepID=A0ACC1RGN0_9HYPO|nr:hypothetical protein NM208_g14824 [Fusarium decemcellulare]
MTRGWGNGPRSVGRVHVESGGKEIPVENLTVIFVLYQQELPPNRVSHTVMAQQFGPDTQLQETLAANPLQADVGRPDNPQDGDSAYNASDASSSLQASLASSILNYKYENGRRYHAFREGTYLVPNDEEEQDRMDLVHHLYCLALGGELFLAPLADEPSHVADLYPSAEVISTDLSPIQPGWTPPNCIFEVDDFESDWPYRKPFDFIHARELEGCIGNEKRLFDQAFQHLAPGGYVEFQATYARFLSDDDTAKEATNAQFWLKTLIDGLAQFGKPLDCAIGWKEKMEAAGFFNVQQEIRKVPVGSWPKDPKLKELGKFQGIQQMKAVESYTPAVFGRILGWSNEEAQVLIAKVRKELTDPKIHLYIPVYFVWGKRP